MVVTEHSNTNFSIDISPLQDAIRKVNIVVPAAVVYKLYKHFALTQQHTISAYGFHKRVLPFDYIDQNYRTTVLKHIREFLLRYCVGSFLDQRLRELKIVVAARPKLTNINIDKDLNMFFEFDIISTAKIPDLQDWRYLLFRPSQRKNYKDLDKQATLFISTEHKNELLYKAQNGTNATVQPDDWVCFTITLIDLQHQSVIDHKEQLWFKISNEEDALPYREVFLDKKVGAKFISNAGCLQDFFNKNIDTRYDFEIEIIDIVPNSFFSLDAFQRHFKLKTKKKGHQKLIEVFSSKNDLSLHRNIVEELFELCFNHHKIPAPLTAVAEQKSVIINSLLDSADYPVYRMQAGFEAQIENLAHKQVRETVLIDSLAYLEDIQVGHDDVRNYLNLAQRPRTKEFIYFKHPAIIANVHEYPTSDLELKQHCLREKTLNHVINYLSER